MKIFDPFGYQINWSRECNGQCRWSRGSDLKQFFGCCTNTSTSKLWKRLKLWIPVQNNSGLLGLRAHTMPNYLLRDNRELPWPKLPKDKALPQSWLSLGLSSKNCNQGEQEVRGCGRALKGNNKGMWERYIMIRRLFPAF